MSRKRTSEQDNLNKDNVTLAQQMITSCVGSIITSLLMTPFDVVKIRLQAEGKNIGVLSIVTKVARNEGISTFWSGLGLTMATAVPCTMLYFTTYERLRSFLRRQQGAEEPYWAPPVAGATARGLAVTIVSPLELIKTKIQSKKINHIETINAITSMLRTEGYPALFKGLGSTLIRDVPFSDSGRNKSCQSSLTLCTSHLWFALHLGTDIEDLKYEALWSILHCMLAPLTGIYWFSYELVKSSLPPETPVFGASFFSGFIAGSAAAIVTAPFDVVKTHQQIEWGGNLQKRKNIPQVIHHIYRTAGIMGLFAGLTPRLLKVAPACAIMISCYEFGKDFFYRYNKKLSV